MASPAYCLFCFETLSSHYDSSEPPSLSKVEDSWEAYQKAIGAVPAEDPSTDDLDVDGDDDAYEEEQDNDDDGDDQDVDEETATNLTTSRSTLQPPSISALRATGSPLSSASSSAPSSTPSSSTSHLTTPSTTSSSTSYSSILRTASKEPSYPIFVTWSTISTRSSHKHLRGCIGTFEALPLSKGLETYALTSALDDQRFNPIPSSLLPQLFCSITLLADFTTASNPLDWDLGVHGIRISFTSPSGTRRYGATYLPDVAVEQGWTKEETIESLMRKAGWEPPSSSSSSRSSYYSSTTASTVGVARRLIRGKSSDATDAAAKEDKKLKPWEQVQDFRTVRYTGLRASASFAEWRDWRRWAEEHGALTGPGSKK